MRTLLFIIGRILALADPATAHANGRRLSLPHGGVLTRNKEEINKQKAEAVFV